MTVQELIPTGYALIVTPAEREQLLVALEVAVGLARGESLYWMRGLVGDLDADRLDGMCDGLFLASAQARAQLTA